MTPREILIAARALIADLKSWTQGAYQRDAKGRMCKPENAVCWCSEAAILRSGRGFPAPTWAAADILQSVVGGLIFDWNDAPDRTHAEVLAAFDRAIEVAP
jgi:hypothetical protein